MSNATNGHAKQNITTRKLPSSIKQFIFPFIRLIFICIIYHAQLHHCDRAGVFCHRWRGYHNCCFWGGRRSFHLRTRHIRYRLVGPTLPRLCARRRRSRYRSRGAGLIVRFVRQLVCISDVSPHCCACGAREARFLVGFF